MAKRRIGIDARLYGIHDRGLGRYVAEIIDIISPLKETYEIVCFVSPNNTEAHALIAKGFEVVDAPWRTYSWGEQWHFARALNSANLDLMFFPHFNVPIFYRRKFIVTIHDLILHHFPNRRASTLPAILYWCKYALYRLVLCSTVLRARHIVAVSSFTAEDLEDYYPDVKHRLTVVKEPTPEFASLHLPNDKNSDVVYTVNEPFVLVVGAFYPHKNLERVCRAWQAIAPTETLLLVGRMDAFAERLKSTVANVSKIVFFGQASDAELRELYARARFVLVPSLYEGVGLPGIEALALGTPVVSSALSALPEIYAPRALYIPADNGAACTHALARVLHEHLELPRSEAPFPSIDTEEVRQAFHKIFSNVLT